MRRRVLSVLSLVTFTTLLLVLPGSTVTGQPVPGAAAQRGDPAVAGFGFGQAPSTPGGFTLLLAAYHWADGTVEGRYDIEERGIRYRGDVTCLVVLSDTAYAGGPVYEVDGHTVEHAGFFLFAIVAGSGGQPQRLGRGFDPHGPGPSDRNYCSDVGGLVDIRPLVRGAFVVRP